VLQGGVVAPQSLILGGLRLDLLRHGSQAGYSLANLGSKL
jgi:hypothetical protein